MSKTDEKCLKLIDFGLSKNFIEGPAANLMGSGGTNESPDPSKRPMRKQPKNNMKTKAGTVVFLPDLAVLHRS